jgi:hypothetical protein
VSRDCSLGDRGLPVDPGRKEGRSLEAHPPPEFREKPLSKLRGKEEKLRGPPEFREKTSKQA